MYGSAMLTAEQKKKIETICFKSHKFCTDAEYNIEMVSSALSSCLECDFGVFFELGFYPEGVAEAFEAIGHKNAAYTVRLANRLFRCDSSDPALKILADAVGLMQDSIESLLVDYLELYTSDSQH